LQTSADLAKETSQATTELQMQLQKLLQNLSTFCLKQDSEDLEIDKIISEWTDLQNEASIIFELQYQLIETVNKNQDNKLISEITSLTKAIRKPQDKLIKQLFDAINTAIKEYQLNKNKEWKELNLKDQIDAIKALQLQLSGNPDEEEPGLLHDTEYFWKQAHWLTSRFPDGIYKDVEGLCKVVTQKEIEAKDWSLSPGRYVGVDTSTDEDFDYEARLAEIHIELDGLNEEAITLAKTISENYKSILL